MISTKPRAPSLFAVCSSSSLQTPQGSGYIAGSNTSIGSNTLVVISSYLACFFLCHCAGLLYVFHTVCVVELCTCFLLGETAEHPGLCQLLWLHSCLSSFRRGRLRGLLTGPLVWKGYMLVSLHGLWHLQSKALLTEVTGKGKATSQ